MGKLDSLFSALGSAPEYRSAPESFYHKNVSEADYSQNKKRLEEAESENEKEAAAEEGLKYVIDGATLNCSLCTKPEGKLKVKYDTPSIQGKRTATVKEKNQESLIFEGNCKKSTNSSSPCQSKMKLGEWTNTGSGLVQDQSPLLLKSTIPCEYGGVPVKITDSGQKSEPAKVDITALPIVDEDSTLIDKALSSSDKKVNKLKIISLEGPFDVKTGKRMSKGISRFKDYRYIVEFDKPIENKRDLYWGQSLDDDDKIMALNLRGGTLFDGNKKLKVTLRFGKGDNKYKLHAYLNNEYYNSTTLEVTYNKVVGVVTEINPDNGLTNIELYEVENTANIDENTVVKNIQQDLGGEEYGAKELLYSIKTPTGIALDGIGGLGTGLGNIDGTHVLKGGGKGVSITPNYFDVAWKNGNVLKIKSFNVVKIGKALGKAGNVGGGLIGVTDIGYKWYEEGEFGKETQKATGSFLVGMGGSTFGAEAGAYIGGLLTVEIGGVGAIPGAIIGAIIGGYFGGEAGEAGVEYIQED